MKTIAAGPRRKTAPFEWPAVVLFYSLFAVGATWPTAVLGASGIPGWGWTDEGLFYWNFWMIREWLWEGNPLWHSHMGFGPWGFYFFVNTHSTSYGFIGALLAPFLSLAAAFNLVVLLAFTLAGITAYALARELRLSRAGAFFAGLIFSFSTHRIGQLDGHINLIAVEMIPLAVLAVWRLMTQRGSLALWLAVLGAAFLYTFYASYYTTFYFGIAAILALCAALANFPRRVGRALSDWRLWAGAAALCALLLCAMWPILSSWRAAYDTWRVIPTPELYLRNPGPNLATLLVPPESLIVWRLLPGGYPGDRFYHGIEEEAYLGWLPILLAISAFGFGRRSAGNRRLRATLLASCFIVFLFSLGRTVSWNDHVFDLPAVFSVIDYIPLLNNIRVPGRMLMLLALPLGLLAGLGVDALLSRMRHRAGSAATAVTLAALAILFAAETWRLHPVASLEPGDQIPFDLLERIRTSDEEGMVTVVPLTENPVLENIFQVYHERPSYDLFLARFDIHVLGQLHLRDLGLIRKAADFPPGKSADEEMARSDERLINALRILGIRWLLIAPHPSHDDLVRHYTERMPTNWVASESMKFGRKWTAIEIGDLGETEGRVLLASGEWEISAADADNVIGDGHHAGHIVGQRAKFFLHMNADQAGKPARLIVDGLGLPPRISDGAYQMMKVSWNGRLLANSTRIVEQGPNMFEFEIPASYLRSPWNWIELDFLRDIRVNEAVEGSGDTRVLPLYVLEIAVEFGAEADSDAAISEREAPGVREP